MMKPLLTFGPGYDKAVHRLSFVFLASDGQRRFRCYVPYGDIADYYHLPGNRDVESYFDLDFAHRCAQRTYDELGLQPDGCLIVKLAW